MRKAILTIAIGWTLFSCSEENNTLNPSDSVLQEQGYVKLMLCLPEGAGLTTKSANDQFVDGQAEEYALRDGLIAYFQSDSNNPDRDAQFVKAQPLDLGDWNRAGSDQNLTTKQTYVVNAPLPEEGQQLYALVILNRNQVVTLTTEGELFVGDKAVERLADLQQPYTSSVFDWIGEEANSFFMANAPVADRPVAQAVFPPKVNLLTAVEYTRDYPTAEQPAQPIYVERAVAKVEVAVSGQRTINADGTVTLPVEGQTNHQLILTGWRLNRTNRTTKPVRDVTGYAQWATYSNPEAKTTLNRFFGTEPNPYRVYWAVDGNYGDAPVDALESYAQQHFVVTADEDGDWLPLYQDTETSVAYCPENTTTADEMRTALLTGVVVASRYQLPTGETNAEGDLFTMGHSTAVYGVSKLEQTINQCLYRSGTKAYHFRRGEGTEGDVIDTPACYATYFYTEAGEAMTEADAQILLANAYVGTINFYRGGKSYYQTMPIQHFGDYYTPVTGTESFTDSAHLGRFGVVRNHWYVIYIEGVNSPGYPVKPDPKPDPDPGIDPDPTPIPTPDPSPDTGYGLRTVIHVKPWTVRYQEVEF